MMLRIATEGAELVQQTFAASSAAFVPSEQQPAETLYADDLEENCIAASVLGLPTLYVTPGINLVHWFTTQTHR